MPPRPPQVCRIEYRNCDPGKETPFRDDTVYVMAYDGVPKLVVMKCPNKECGQILQISTDPAQKPHWSLTPHTDKTISIYPPIKHECGVRFFISYGTIQFREDPKSDASA